MNSAITRLRLLAVDRVAYSPARFKDGQQPHSIVILGVPDRDRSVLTDRNDVEVVSTGDDERLILTRFSLGIPASALSMWDQLERARNAFPEHPLHNIPGFPPHKDDADDELDLDAATPLPIPVEGPRPFIASMRRVFSLLARRAPKRYEEAKRFMPKAVYEPAQLQRESPGAYARSDGLFSRDGSGSEHDRDFFLFAFLHEVGHNVAIKRRNDHSERSADQYANRVFKELGYRFGWQQDESGTNRRFEYAIPIALHCGDAPPVRSVLRG